jgi:polysaccharide pyruvyl transferase WcaK-like protein
MLIELHGAGFSNKGAQLMLWTVIQQLAAPGVRFCIDGGPDQTYEQRAEYGLRLLFPVCSWQHRPRRLPAHFRISAAIGRLVPRSVLDNYGLVRRQDTDALVDVSGYAFGDKWGPRPIRNMSIRASDYKRRGKPVILLPQMFGPFEDRSVASEARRLLNFVSLAYAREEQSLRWLQQVAGPNSELRIAPDITIFTDGSAAPPPDYREYVWLVPNIRMLDNGGQRWSRTYLTTLANAGRQARELGHNVGIMVHDPSDLKLARQLAEQLPSPAVPILQEDDPRRLKAVLSGAKLIVGSRFHSIVGALSSSVPCIALGWAHKYQAIMEDFGVAELMVHDRDPPERLTQMVRETLRSEGYTRLRTTLRIRKDALRRLSHEMWQHVRKTLTLPALGGSGC